MPTDAEIIASLKTDWLPTDFYNFQDMNRVEEATRIVNEKVKEYRGITNNLTFKTDRTYSSIDFAADLNRIESNILTLAETFDETKMETFKTNWASNQPFTYVDANRLERNLNYMYNFITANQLAVPYCGQYTTGQQGVY